MKIPKTVRQHWVHKKLWTKERSRVTRYYISEVRMGDTQIV